MTRAFFDQVDDELRGLLGPQAAALRTQKSARLIKVWFGDPALHFEAQRIAPHWSPKRTGVIEVGLHIETRTKESNEEILNQLGARSSQWRRKLPRAEPGRAFGPQSSMWRRLSEVIEDEDVDDPDLAGEVAERLAAYIRTLRPLLSDGA